MECALSGSGPPTDAADVLVVAEPEEDGVNILLQYIPSVIPLEQAERLARNLSTMLETGHVEFLSPNTISPTDSTWSLVAADSDEETGKAQSLVTEAWREMKIFREGVLPEANVSMFDCGADVVSALLLSRAYQGLGYDVGVADIPSNPTQRAQSRLLLDEFESAEKSLGSDNMIDELYPQAYSVRAVAPSDSVARKRDVRYDLSDADLIHMDGHIANYVVFPLKEGSKTASISAALETALSETLARLPFLAGRVLRDSAKR